MHGCSIIQVAKLFIATFRGIVSQILPKKNKNNFKIKEY